MNKLFQNSVAIVGVVGRPTWFIIFTTNSNCPEINSWIRSDQTHCDVAVFSCASFFTYVSFERCEKGCTGKVTAFIVSIEFQKRGLPHGHILLCMDKDSQRNSPEQIDELAQAVIPVLQKKNEPNYESLLRVHRAVFEHNIHKPCAGRNYSCLDGCGKCSKAFC